MTKSVTIEICKDGALFGVRVFGGAGAFFQTREGAVAEAVELARLYGKQNEVRIVRGSFRVQSSSWVEARPAA